ncbi:hypothetical protein BCF55_1101 [Hydrogenivirga caldilitoris]|uniref:Uncharacterized protein n=1 Tax=Hydrogenivirga caldilitoris TaxID=246264 RepID=A0A497XPK3_9AQUI|nr:hypothetical protein [Hydrogenivirga caldilitoris]RLJ70818.1 hypothetical protein BCF55_1101 [Hydrogenivirga caldilitoris]
MAAWRTQRISQIIQRLNQLKEIIAELSEDGIPSGNITINNIPVPFSEIIDDSVRLWLNLSEESLREVLDQLPLSYLMHLDNNLSQAISNYSSYKSTNNVNNFQTFISHLNNINTYLNLPIAHYPLLSQIYRDIDESPKYISEIKNFREKAEEEFNRIKHLLENTKTLHDKTWSWKQAEHLLTEAKKLDDAASKRLKWLSALVIFGVIGFFFLSYCPPSYINSEKGLSAIIHLFLLKLPILFIIGLIAFLLWEDYIKLKKEALTYTHKAALMRTMIEGEPLFRERFNLSSEEILSLILKPIIRTLLETEKHMLIEETIKPTRENPPKEHEG